MQGISDIELREGYKKTILGWIPIDWEIVSLGRHSQIDPENLSSRMDSSYSFRYISLSDIYRGKIGQDLTIFQLKDAPSRAKRIVKKNDVLLGTVRPNLKAFALVEKDDNDLIASTGFSVIRTKEKLNSVFLFHTLFSHNIEKQLFNLVVGSNYPAVNSKDVRNLKILLPPLPEQQKIAKILATWDKAIAKQEALISQKQKLKKGLMQQLLTGKKRFKGFDGEWDKFKLGELTEIYDGTHSTPKYVARGIPFYSVENVSNDDFQKTKYISESVFEKENERVVLEKGDILMTRIGDIGTPKLLNWDVRASFYVSLSLIKKNKRIKPEFLEQFIQSTFFQKELFKRTIHVAFPKKINLGEIGHCHIYLPSQEEQNKIASVLSSADQEIALLKEHLKNLEKQKQGLMQKLLTGEIRV